MTDLLSLEDQETATTGPSSVLHYPLHPHLHHHHHHLTARQSSEVEYEIAQQLVQHSQGRRDDGGASMVDANKERISSVKPVMPPQEDHSVLDNSTLQRSEDVRRTPSQERPPDTQYSPVSIPPAKGQMCRYGVRSKVPAKSPKKIKGL